jgi:heme-degrading monooxygenase HmoA
MVEIVYEYVVKEEARGQFELLYGPGGAWGKLFAGCPGFRGATLLRDTENLRRYLAIDLWDTEAQRAQALVEHGVAYAELETTLNEWTESKAKTGVFRVQAEATVRPRGRARRRGNGLA